MTIEAIERCGICRSYLDEEDLFCANCGTENPHADASASRLAKVTDHHSFECDGCGASMSYDASAKALRCPFCGSTEMHRKPGVRSIQPDLVVPFSIAKEQATKRLKAWLSEGFWKPSDAARASTIGEMTAVLVPYWVFNAECDTSWTGDTSVTPMGSRGDWAPLSGTNRSRYENILVGGSSVLTPRETASIEPFQTDQGVPPEQFDLQNTTFESFRVPRKLARPLARGVIEERERLTCSQYISGRSRNVKVNVKIESMIGRPCLLPVWILAYRYKKEVYRVLINGQTGKISGTSPFAYGKLTIIIVIVALVIAAIVAIAVLANR